jgi:hypothetical protein
MHYDLQRHELPAGATFEEQSDDDTNTILPTFPGMNDDEEALDETHSDNGEE